MNKEFQSFLDELGDSSDGEPTGKEKDPDYQFPECSQNVANVAKKGTKEQRASARLTTKSPKQLQREPYYNFCPFGNGWWRRFPNVKTAFMKLQLNN